WKTFKTSANEVKYTVVAGIDGIEVTPDDITDKIRVKLGFGIEHSGWTPNLEDTGQLVANVQEYTSEFEQTSKQIKADVSALEIDVGDLGKNVSDVESELNIQAGLIEQKVDSNK